MSCQNEPCLEKCQFTNSKDGKQFCSPECAKEFYKAPTVRVAAGRSSQEEEFVEVSKNHPAFNIMNTKEKEMFLSFGRDKAVGLGSDRQDVHRVHVAIKEALYMIGAGEDDKKRKQEDDDDARKKQITRRSYLDVLPADIQVVTLRYEMIAMMKLEKKDSPYRPYTLSPNFFKSPLFLDLFEKNPSRLPMLFNIEWGDVFSTFATSVSAYRSFAEAVQQIILKDKGTLSPFSVKLMKVVSDSYRVVWNLGKDTGRSSATIRDTIVQLKAIDPTFTNSDVKDYIDDRDVLLFYAMSMNVNIVDFPLGVSGSINGNILHLLRNSVRVAMSTWKLVSRQMYEHKILGAGREEYVGNLVYLVCWLMKDYVLADDNFNPMADRYLFIELIRQIAQKQKSHHCSLFYNPYIVEAYEIFVNKLFEFQPMGQWAQGTHQVYPYNPFRIYQDLFNEARDNSGNPYMAFREVYKNREKNEPKEALTKLRFETYHIRRYNPKLQVLCFHRFPGQHPNSGKRQSMPNDDAWKKITKDALYSYIQAPGVVDEHLCVVLETKLGLGLWDTELDETVPMRELEDDKGEDWKDGTRQKLIKQNLLRLCSYKDRNGNVATFKMSDGNGLSRFETFLDGLKVSTFRGRDTFYEFHVVSRYLDPDTRPVVIECYNKNMPVYTRTQKKVDPFMTFLDGEFYLFTLYNYVNGLVPTVRENAHTIDGLDKLIRWYPGFVGQHRLILYTAPDRKSQTVLYIFGRDEKVDWERHPNVQMIYTHPSHPIKVTIKNADGSLSIYEGSRQPIMIPADTEHLIQGSNVSFLSTYFPAEDEPVFKINGIPVYKEWGQPPLYPLSNRDEQAVPMEQ